MDRVYLDFFSTRESSRSDFKNRRQALAEAHADAERNASDRDAALRSLAVSGTSEKTFFRVL